MHVGPAQNHRLIDSLIDVLGSMAVIFRPGAHIQPSTITMGQPSKIACTNSASK